MGNDNVQTIRRAALKDDDETLVARSGVDGAECGAGQEAWDRGRPDHGEGAVAKKNPSRDCHVTPRRDLGCYVFHCRCPRRSKLRLYERIYLL